MAVDASHLYWATRASGSVWRANLDGSDPQAIAPARHNPAGVAVDADHVYWTNSGDGSDGWLDLAGRPGREQPSRPRRRPEHSVGVAVDASHLYWTTPFDGNVNQANLDGTNPHAIVTGQKKVPGWVAVAWRVTVPRFLYWANNDDGTISWWPTWTPATPSPWSAARPEWTGWRSTAATCTGPTVTTARSARPTWTASNPHTLITGQNVPVRGGGRRHHLYWAKRRPDRSGWANLDGSDAEAIVEGQDNPVGVAVDATTSTGPTAARLIWRANLDGSSGPEALVTGQNDPSGWRSNGSNLYWTDRQGVAVWRANLDGTNPRPSSPTRTYPWASRSIRLRVLGHRGGHLIWRANLDGTGAEAIVETGAEVPFGVAVNGTHLYWSEARAGTINRANLDGTGAQAIVSGQASLGLMAVTPPAPPRLAFSPSSYDFGQVGTGEPASQTFTLANTGGQATGALTVAVTGAAALAITADTCAGVSLVPGASCSVTVRFAPATAGAIDASLIATSPSTTATAEVELSGTGVVIRVLFWTNNAINQPDGTGTLNRARLDGSNRRTLAGNQDEPTGVAATATNVYWAAGETIFVAGLDGSNRRSLIPGQSGLEFVAVDDTHLYWTRSSLPGSSSTLWRANLDGTDRQQIGTGGYFAQGVAVDANNVYWATSTSLEPGDGTIWRAGLDGSNPQAVATGQDSPSGVAVDADYLYWSSSGNDGAGDDDAIIRANLDGTSPRAIVTNAVNPVGLATDGSAALLDRRPARHGERVQPGRQQPAGHDRRPGLAVRDRDPAGDPLTAEVSGDDQLPRAPGGDLAARRSWQLSRNIVGAFVDLGGANDQRCCQMGRCGH